MSLAYINGIDTVTAFNATLIDYSIGSVDINDSYLTQKYSMIPIKLKEMLGVRPVKLELEFTGSSYYDITLAISNLTAVLIQETEILLPDGFYYTVMLKKAGTPKYQGHLFYTVDFTLEGYRHGAMQTFELEEELTSVYVQGNCEAPAIITITNATTDVTVNDITVKNIDGDIVINGLDKTVTETVNGIPNNKYKDCEMTKFPSLKNGLNEIHKTGTARIEISYRPMYL